MFQNAFNFEPDKKGPNYELDIPVKYQRSFKTWFLIRFAIILILLIQVILIVYAYIRWPAYEDSALERILTSLTVALPSSISLADKNSQKLFSYPQTKEGYQCSADNGSKNCASTLVCIDKKYPFAEEEENNKNNNGYYDLEEDEDKYEDPDCKPISAKKPLKVFKWKGISIGFEGQRSYIDIINSNEYALANRFCTGNTKKCGILDSNGLQLCVDRNTQCPINYIEFSEDKYCTKFPECRSIQIYENTYLHFSNRNTDGIVVGLFDISETEEICADFKEKTTNRNTYILENFSTECSNKINGFTVDNRYYKLDTDSVKNFYNQSGIEDHLLSLPKIDLDKIISDENVTLFYSNFFGIKESCLGQANDIYKKLNALRKGIEDQLGLNKILLFMLMIGMVAFFTLSAVLFFCPCCEVREYTYPVASLIFIMAPFIVSTIIVKNLDVKGIPKDCFDPIINGNLNNNMIEVNYVFGLHLANLIFTIVDIGLLITALVMICVGMDNEPPSFKLSRDLDKFRILFFHHYKVLEEEEKEKERKEEEHIAKVEEQIKKEIEMQYISSEENI
ncbi:MAG: hypothetical protein MJ252_12180 [archaeon]|nr:hypothetical protein [archaeon]